jgi:hypothetical protein
MSRRLIGLVTVEPQQGLSSQPAAVVKREEAQWCPNGGPAGTLAASPAGGGHDVVQRPSYGQRVRPARPVCAWPRRLGSAPWGGGVWGAPARVSARRGTRERARGAPSTRGGFVCLWNEGPWIEPAPTGIGARLTHFAVPQLICLISTRGRFIARATRADDLCFLTRCARAACGGGGRPGPGLTVAAAASRRRRLRVPAAAPARSPLRHAGSAPTAPEARSYSIIHSFPLIGCLEEGGTAGEQGFGTRRGRQRAGQGAHEQGDCPLEDLGSA